MPSTADDPISAFEAERHERIARYPAERAWRDLSMQWTVQAFRNQYMYNFAWLGRPVIQMPNDLMALAEIIWETRPDLVIETGIAHGGSLIFSASMLALLDVCDSEIQGADLVPGKSRRRVLGIDIDIRAHNRMALERHPLFSRVTMIDGSSTAPTVIEQVLAIAAEFERVMVCLDSNHTEAHVLAELEAYAPLTSKGLYCVVFDTIIEHLPPDMFPDRPWKVGDNSKTAAQRYLRLLTGEGRMGSDGAPLRFEVDGMTENKLLISAAPGGYLRRV